MPMYQIIYLKIVPTISTYNNFKNSFLVILYKLTTFFLLSVHRFHNVACTVHIYQVIYLKIEPAIFK